MSIRLYDHQLEALGKIETGKVLCGGVGSGKSITSVAWYYLKNGGSLQTLTGGDYIPMKNPKDLYIITTARKRDTHEWEQELAPFKIGVGRYDNKVVIDSWNNISKYSEVKNAYILFDEQRVTGSGPWVKNFIKLAKTNEWILLSATPGDTWMDYIPLFVANGFYKNRTEFIHNHVVYSSYSKYPKVSRYFGERKLEMLRNHLIIKMEFKKPAEQHHFDVQTGYSMEQYRYIIRNRWDIWNNVPIQNAGGLCLAMRKLVNTDPSRRQAVLNIVKSHPRVIIFYNFDYELEILKELGESLTDITVAQWNGHQHEPIPKTDKWIYLVQYTAGAEGWNCIETDTIIFFSQNYSYKVMIQASGRIDRLNTPYTDLYYYHLKSKSSIDIAISRALSDKKTFNEKAFVKW